MGRSKEYNYFVELEQLSECCYGGCALLHKSLSAPEHKLNEEHTAELAVLKSKMKDRIQTLRLQLFQEFMTPIEREDIFIIAQQLESLMDALNTVVSKVHILKLNTIKSDAVKISKNISDSCEQICRLIKELENLRKSKKYHEIIAEIERITSACEEQYKIAFHDLYHSYHNPSELFLWTELFTELKFCCMLAKNVSVQIEIIIFKNL